MVAVRGNEGTLETPFISARGAAPQAPMAQVTVQQPAPVVGVVTIESAQQPQVVVAKAGL
mgnify:CR=1 FL=1